MLRVQAGYADGGALGKPLGSERAEVVELRAHADLASAMLRCHYLITFYPMHARHKLVYASLLLSPK